MNAILYFDWGNNSNKNNSPTDNLFCVDLITPLKEKGISRFEFTPNTFNFLLRKYHGDLQPNDIKLKVVGSLTDLNRKDFYFTNLSNLFEKEAIDKDYEFSVLTFSILVQKENGTYPNISHTTVILGDKTYLQGIDYYFNTFNQGNGVTQVDITFTGFIKSIEVSKRCIIYLEIN